jgi:hypothetical protein
MKPNLIDGQIGKISEQVAALDSLGTAKLQERWRALFETEPHPRLGRELLIRAVAYRLQQQALGGLRPATCLCRTPIRRRLGSEIMRCNVAARNMTQVLRLGVEVRHSGQPA